MTVVVPLAPITFVLLVIAVTASAVEGSILWGLLPFLIALINEILRMMIVRQPTQHD